MKQLPMKRDNMSRRIAGLALLIAVSAATLVALRVTAAFDIYCDGSRQCVDLLIAAIPRDVALLGMTLPTLLLARSLRQSPASRYLRASAIGCGILALAAYLVMTVSAYDSMWATYGSTALLDAPRFTPFLPSIILSTSLFFWPLLLGATIVLTNAVLDALQLSRIVLALGVGAGLILMASQTLASDTVVATYVGFGIVGLWAAALAVQTLTATRRVRSTA